MIKAIVRSPRRMHVARDGRSWPYQEIDVIYPTERNPIADRLFLDAGQLGFPEGDELVLDITKCFSPGKFNRLTFRPHWVPRAALVPGGADVKSAAK